jgi:hypothetical protein
LQFAGFCAEEKKDRIACAILPNHSRRPFCAAIIRR